MKELFLKFINHYFMKAGQHNTVLQRIDFNMMDKSNKDIVNAFSKSPKIIFTFIDKNNQSNRYEFIINLKEFKIFLLECMNKDSFDFEDLSRKKLKILIIRFIRKKYIANVVKQCADKISKESEIKQNMITSLEKYNELKNFYKANTTDCDNDYNGLYSEFKNRIRNDLSYNIQLKHFKVMFDKELNDDIEFSKLKEFISKF